MFVSTARSSLCFKKGNARIKSAPLGVSLVLSMRMDSQSANSWKLIFTLNILAEMTHPQLRIVLAKAVKTKLWIISLLT